MRQSDFVIRECEDCHEEMMDNQRRIRCKNCGKLVCTWCYNHVHSLLLPASLTEKAIIK